MWEGTGADCLPISVVTHGKHFETENLSSSQVATFHLFDAARFLTPDLRAGAVVDFEEQPPAGERASAIASTSGIARPSARAVSNGPIRHPPNFHAIVSRNLSPDKSGLPEGGSSFQEFLDHAHRLGSGPRTSGIWTEVRNHSPLEIGHKWCRFEYCNP